MTSGPAFSEVTKQTLAKRAGQVCSNPDCRRPTSGPHSDENKAVNLGEAAHVRAARPGQARYDAKMTDEERAAISNGIWLCKECARRIDVDEAKYPVALLAEWKGIHEKWISDGKPELGRGGRGGNAKISGNGVAIGGRGGRGGVPGSAFGGDGGNAEVIGDGFALGGEGGEAGQANRGGRGGRSPFEVLGIPNQQFPDGSWLWDKGRGGDGGVAPPRDLHKVKSADGDKKD